MAESNSSGEATLNTLREFAPKPSDRDANLKAIYAFCVRSPGYAERWIGGVSRGQDLGIIKLEAALTLRGEIKLDDPDFTFCSFRYYKFCFLALRYLNSSGIFPCLIPL